MLSMVLLGTGNVARHLFDVFSAHREIQLVQVVGRNEKTLSYFRKNANTSNSFKNISDADVYIIAVSDTAIESVSQQLTAKKGLIVHTSGSASIMELRANERNGIFYPLQTFSKNRAANFQNIPIC
ncbi:MAG: NAD(P)-binding domain-containing protein, partial [Bacteroidota bacterium]